MEALWATWGHQQPSTALLDQALAASDYRVRSAAVRVVRHSLHLLEAPQRYLKRAAKDAHQRVRLEALSAATWLGGRHGAEVLITVASEETDKWTRNALNSAILLLKDDVHAVIKAKKIDPASIPYVELLFASKLPGAEVRKDYMTKASKKRARQDKGFRDAYTLGRQVFHKDGSCSTCHQETGEGLENIYPPIAKSRWVTGDKERLIKLTLHGIWGEITVNGKTYDPSKGVPPMTAVGAMFDDNQVAAVLTYARNSWGNQADPITPGEVKAVRAATSDRKIFYKPEELLQEHPFPTEE